MSKQKTLILPILLLLIIIAMAFGGLTQDNQIVNAVINEDVLAQYNNSSVLTIDTPSDWRRFTKLPYGYTFSGKTVVLNCDIDLKIHPYTFNNFFGTFEGNNQSVYNADRPLFSSINSQGVVKDLHFYNSNITSHNAAVVTTNNGLMQNVTSHGYIESANVSGLAQSNHGRINKCISYMTIKDNTNSGTNYVGGITYLNLGEIVDSHYFGKLILTNNIIAGGISAINLGEINKCSSRIDLDINVNKTVDLMEVGGLVGQNGIEAVVNQETVRFYGNIHNSSATLNVNYISEEPLDFVFRKLAVAGLIGNSRYTEMTYCYSYLFGEGNLYGIINSTLATPITEEVIPEEPDEPYEIVIGYQLHGSEGILNCFSVNSLQPIIMRATESGSIQELLSLSNQTITLAQLLNSEAECLTDKLQNIDADWAGASGQFPVCSPLFDGEGTTNNPFLIRSKEDIFKLQGYLFNQPLTYFFKQVAEIDFSYTYNAPFNLNMNFTSVYDGNDFAIHNYNSTALFARNSGVIHNLGFIGGNLGNTIVEEQGTGTISNCYTSTFRFSQSLYVNPNIYEGRQYVLAESFGYTGVESFTVIARAADFASGDGTQANPYLIETAEQLAKIGSLLDTQYASLANDIQINSSKDSEKNRLSIGGFSGNLDGKGYSVIGLINEPLVGSLTGTISNLSLRTIRSLHDYAGIAADTVEVLGRLNNIKVYGSVSGAESGGIAGSNLGHIDLCINYAVVYGLNSSGICGLNNSYITKSGNKAKTTYGIASNGAEGIIENCYDEGNSVNIYNSAGTINKSLQKTLAAVRLWNNDNIVFNQSALTVTSLRDFSDFNLNVWGYRIGNNSCPEIKVSGVFYKEDLASAYFNKSLTHNRTYNQDISTRISSIENELVLNYNARNDISFQWFYNDVAFDAASNPFIKNAGVYKVMATYSGNNYIYAFTYTYKITISKAVLPTPDFYNNGTGISGIHFPCIYNGEIYDISQIKANNLIEKGITESDYSYLIKKSGQTVPNIKEAGIYDVTVTINSVNYNTLSVIRTVTITKANLTITLDNKEIDYLQSIPMFTYSIQVQTNTGADANEIAFSYQNALQAIAEAEGEAVCNYTAGDNIGDYEIDYNVSLFSYNVNVIKGNLKVNAIQLTDDNIIYIDKEEVYNGYIIPMNAQLNDDDISVNYLNNNNKDAGIHEVVAIFSKQNYLNLELTAFLTILEAPLIIKAKDIEIDYGEAAPIYTFDHIEFLGDDNINSLSGNASFSCSYTQGDDIGVYDIAASGLSSNNYDITFQNGQLTVNRAFMTSVFTYSNVVYVYDGQQKTNPIDISGYATTVTYNYYRNQSIILTPPTNAGVYTVVAHVASISDNYKDTSFSATLTINKADIDVYFLPQYTLEYDGEFHNIEYESALPSDEVWTINQTGIDRRQQQTHSSFRDAGVYDVSMTFSGNDNFNLRTITTTLTIEPRLLEINTLNAIYKKAPITPEYDIIGEVVEGDILDIAWEYSLFGYGYEFAVQQVTNASKYTCYPVSINTNYIITNTPEFTIEKLTVMFSPNIVEFTYGTYSDFTYNSRSYTSGRTFVIQRNYFIEATSDSVNVEYFYNGPNAGLYDVTGVKDTSNYDFELVSGSGVNKVRVLKRTLTYSWNATSITTEYNAAVQMPFEINIGNIVSGDRIDRNIISSGNNRDAGVYTITAELLNNNNYLLTVQPVTLEITKAPLTIRANDMYVVRGTESVNFTATITGLKGNDTITSMGKQLVYSCAYSVTSPTGITLPITIQSFTLENYNVTFINGTLSVTSNQYPQMSMSNKSFVYDGNTKALTLDQSLPSGATVMYQNNFKRDVGVYNVTARVTFPNSTVQNLSATLTITKASPALFVEDIVLPYYIFANLENDDIIGIAKINTTEIAGVFSWVGDKSLKRHTNQYQVMFTPNDTNNINSATTTINVEGKVIGIEALVSNRDDVIITEDKIYITTETTLSLSTAYNNLRLYSNGVLNESIILNDSGEHTIEIKYKNGTVFSKNYKVIKHSNDNTDEPEIPQGLKKFNISGGIVTDDDSVGRIIIADEEIIIRISEEYIDDMELFLNGDKVPFIIFYGNEGNADIQVKYRGILIYSKTFRISVAPMEKPEEISRNWLWAKILGGILGGIGLVALLFFGLRAIIKRSRTGYNPYEMVERKRRKLKRKFK